MWFLCVFWRWFCRDYFAPRLIFLIVLLAFFMVLFCMVLLVLSKRLWKTAGAFFALNTSYNVKNDYLCCQDVG